MTKKTKLWGGRFNEEPNEVFREFNDSLALIAGFLSPMSVLRSLMLIVSGRPAF